MPISKLIMRETIETYELFEILSPESTGLLLLKKRNFDAFLKMLGVKEIERFKEYKKLLMPDDKAKIGEWVAVCLSRLGVTSKKFCEDMEFNQVRFSRYINGKQVFDTEEIEKIQTEIQRRLIAANLIAP